MATRRKTSAKSQPGGMVSGIVIGVALGLAAAVAVALYVTKAPMPFMDKAGNGLEQVRLPDIGQALDPNKGLYSNIPTLEGPLFAGQEPAKGDTQAAPPPVPAIPVPTAPDTLGNLIAQLPHPHSATSTAQTSPATPKAAAPQITAAPTTYYLQAGAFRSLNDAETMRARILLLGMDASLQSAPYENGTINRVRVGPFTGLDEMNKARSALGREKIETSVVRP